MKKNSDFYIFFVLGYQLLSIVLFKLVHFLYPSSLIFDQVFFLSVFMILAISIVFRLLFHVSFDRLVAVISLSLVLMFLNQSVLLNIDRSRSTFVLAWVDRGFVTLDSSSEIQIRGSKSPEATNEIASVQRVEENYQRGLIKLEDGKFHLSMIGKVLLAFCDWTANFFDLRGWKLNSS
jgi:hypothetical protein